MLPIPIVFATVTVGVATMNPADTLVEDAVVAELKAEKTLDSVHTTQCINYTRRPKE